MITWNQTWHPTCRTWLWQMEQCLNSALLPVPIKQNTQKLKSNGRTKIVQFLEVNQKRWEQRACQRKLLHRDQRKKLVTKAGTQKDWEMYFWSAGMWCYHRKLKYFKTSRVKVQKYLDPALWVKTGTFKILISSEQKFYWRYPFFLVNFEISFWCQSVQLHRSHCKNSQLGPVGVSKIAATRMSLGVALGHLC